MHFAPRLQLEPLSARNADATRTPLLYITPAASGGDLNAQIVRLRSAYYIAAIRHTFSPLSSPSLRSSSASPLHEWVLGGTSERWLRGRWPPPDDDDAEAAAAAPFVRTFKRRQHHFLIAAAAAAVEASRPAASPGITTYLMIFDWRLAGRRHMANCERANIRQNQYVLCALAVIWPPFPP